MRLTLCCIGLLLLTICCWQCMGRPKHDHSKEHSDSKEHDHSKEHSDSKEHDHSKEHSHSEEHDHSEDYEHGSHSHEHSSSKEDSSSSEEISRSCRNGKRNKKETDIDCGGKKCPPCVNGRQCLVKRDCASKFCKDGRCAQPATRKPSVTATTQAVKTTTAKKPITTTTEEVTSTTEEPMTTTPEEPMTTTPEEPMTTTPEEPMTTTPEEPMTTTPEEPMTTTTEEVMSTPEEPMSTPDESTTTEEMIATPEELISVTTEEALGATMEELIIAEPVCNPGCQNGGTCIADSTCSCPADFSGPTCEVQSAGLCVDKDTFDVEPILKVTFGKGSRPFSIASPSEFNFTTTYTQRREPTIDDGYFAFINSIYNHHDAWHTGAKDHTGDEGGYMYVVNANFEPGQFYSGKVDNLCVGLRYEFSVYLANICKKAGRIDPNVLFEVRSADGNELLAQLNSGNVPERDTLTWEKYGVSFIATHSSVKLLMISNTRGGSGNDIVIDDIALRVCAHKGSGFCPSE